MAYMSQDRKRELVAEAKKVLKRYGMKATFKVRHHSTIVCTIKSGPLDLIGNSVIDAHKTRAGCMDVNVYHYRNHFSGECLKFIDALVKALNAGNWDKSDAMTDYFNVGWYVDLDVGKWDKPYVLEK